LTPKAAPKVLQPILPKPTGAVHAPVGHDSDDEPSLFTTLMIFYYGFFGITLLVWPWVHAQDGPFYNPLAYWTTISDDLAFGFRVCGAAFLTLVKAPFFDEIFGGPGVKMMAFTRQMCMANLLLAAIFWYYSFYAPLDTAVPLVWKAQAVFQSFLAGWSITEVVSSSSALKDMYTLFTAFYFGFFALSLASVPALLFGPPSPFTYWETWAPLSVFCGRCLGVGMLCAFILGYVLFSKFDGFVKMCTVWNVAIFGLATLPAYFQDGPSSNATMWQIQLCMQIPIVTVALYLELVGETGPWSFSLPCPQWGVNASTFLFVSLFWYLPFVLAFYTDPNMIFGPSTPTGFPMFTMDIDETGLWFGKAWATVVLLVALGPYLFGLPAVKVVKQLTVAYFLFICYFIFYIATETFMNIMVVGPLVFVNFVFLAAGVYLSLPAQSGEEYLFMA
jgi:hypothetical protein